MKAGTAVIGFDRWREIEGEFLEVPGLTLRQARDQRALKLAVDALLENLFAGTASLRKLAGVRTPAGRAQDRR